jgi:hypothetical protein
MNWLINLIRSLFLVKEIVSQEGNVYFIRYRLLHTPWLAIYIHHILRSDEDLDPHDHPFGFHSILLKGAYSEDAWYPPNFNEKQSKVCYAGDVVEHAPEDAHKLTLLTKDVWTLVFAGKRTRYWGYQTPVGWIGHKEYRQLKREGKLR